MIHARFCEPSTYKDIVPTRKSVLKLFTVVFLVGVAWGQLGGVAPFGAADVHENDVIDLSNLTPTLTIPIISKPGAIPFRAFWTAQQNCAITGIGSQRKLDCRYGARFKAFSPGLLGSQLTYTTTSVACALGYINKYSNFGVLSSDGLRIHPLNYSLVTYETNSCNLTPSTLSNQLTTDGSGYSVSTNCSGTLCSATTITSASGSIFSNGIVRDTFGNTLSCSNPTSCPSGTITDSLGNSTFITTYVAPNSYGTAPDYVQWADTVGTNRQISLTYGSALTLSYPTTSPCPFMDSLNGQSFTPISEIDFPDGNNMGVTFEQGAGGVGTTTGRIKSFTLRTGGTVTYTYMPLCTTTGGTLTRQGADGITKYTLAGTAGSTVTVTVLDPENNKKVYTFLGQFLLGEDVYQNTGTDTSPVDTLLSSDTYCYNGAALATCRTTQTPAYPITQRDAYHTLGSMSTSSHVKEVYDTFSCSAGTCSYGNIVSIAKYDFGASTPDATTTITYGSWNGATCVAVGSSIVNLPCDVKTTDSASHTLAESRFTYGAKGFRTQAQRWTGATWITSSATPNSNGTAATSTNPLGQVISYSYAGTGSGGCNSMLPTRSSTTLASATLTTGAIWECNGGKLMSSWDANGDSTQASQFTYDMLFRPTSQTDPTGYQISETYPSATTSTVGDSYATTTFLVDQFGRPVRRQTTDGANYDTVSSNYFWEGTQFETGVSEPCIVSAGDCMVYTVHGVIPGEVHFRQIDPLGRTLFTTTESDGSTAHETVSNLYYTDASHSAFDVQTTLSPASSGENNKVLQTEYDGLGRVRSICSVGTVTGAIACGQAIGGSGVLTSFSYTYGPGTTTVKATRGAQTHTAVYDALGRPTSVMTPESGTTTYVYDQASATCSNGAGPGLLMEIIDNSGVHTCQGYDKLGRPTNTFVAGTSAPCRVVQYGDQYTPIGVTVKNVQNRVVDAFTDSNCTGNSKITDEEFSYDKVGRTTDLWETTPHSGGQYYTTAGYASNGQLSSISGVPGKSTYTIGLDTSGRPNSSTYGATAIATKVTYDGGGKTTEIDYGTGNDKDVYTYDESYTGLMNTWNFSIGSANESAILTWNANRTLNTLAITDGFQSAGTQTCTFSYDDVERLQTDNCGSVWNQNYTYDQYDNITKSGTTNWNPGYSISPSNNHITGANYDSDGRLTYDLHNSYAWDGYHKMITANSGASLGSCGSAGVTCVTYDAFGRPVEKNVAGTFTELLYSPIGLTAIMSGQSSTSMRAPIPGGSIFNTSAQFGNVVSHLDWLGSARVSYSLGHTCDKDIAYTPYGETYASVCNTAFPLNFTGDNQDLFSGLYDTPNREFDTSSGSRWLSPDPARAGWNAYAYGTNPNGGSDPSGASWLNDVFSWIGNLFRGGQNLEMINPSMSVTGPNGESVVEYYVFRGTSFNVRVASGPAGGASSGSRYDWSGDPNIDNYLFKYNALATETIVSIGAGGASMWDAPESAFITESTGLYTIKSSGAPALAEQSVPTGSFSIRDWSGYPEGAPRPQGPLRLLEGQEYAAARKAANGANRALRKANPAMYAGKQIHEIQPVKFAGDPLALENKVPLSPDVHADFTNWWNDVQHVLEGPN